jgi:predicted amidophosphoribosyltransferase
MGSPLFIAFALALGALWVLFMALPGLSHPPVSKSEREESKENDLPICPSCKQTNPPNEAQCVACGTPLQKLTPIARSDSE